MESQGREQELADIGFVAELVQQIEDVTRRAPQPHRSRRFIIAVAIGAVAAAVLGGVALAGGFGSGPPVVPDSPLPAESVYPTNAAGLSYGGEKPLVEEPDLVKVTATNGKNGYCLRGDLYASSAPPKSAEETAAREKRALRGYDIPVFESDGVTRIGVFRIGGPGMVMAYGGADGSKVTKTADAEGNIITTTVAKDGSATIETEDIDGMTTTQNLTPDEAARLASSPSPAPAPSRKPVAPPDWLLSTVNGLAREAGDARATVQWQLQTRYYLRPIEGDKSPTSEYAQWEPVWLVILHGSFEGGSWRYWILHHDSHEVLSTGASDRPFDTIRIEPLYGPIELSQREFLQ